MLYILQNFLHQIEYITELTKRKSIFLFKLNSFHRDGKYYSGATIVNGELTTKT